MIEGFLHSRETFSEPDKPESDDLTAEREQKIIEGWVNSESGPNTPEWKDLLDKVNFPLLKKIFTNLALNCGIPEKKVNFIGQERIFSRKTGMFEGQYFPGTNVIVVTNPEDSSYIQTRGMSESEIETWEVEKLKSYKEIFGSIDLVRLRTLIHEETHAVSRNLCIEYIQHPRRPEKNVWGYTQSGFYQDILSDKYKTSIYTDGGSIFTVLNEGVVEKLSREIMGEYLDESGWSLEDATVYKNTSKQNHDGMSYPVEVSVVNSVIKKLALKNGQTEKVIWEAMISALLHGETFEEKEIIELFEESFGPDFLKDLASLPSTAFSGGKEALQKFKQKYNL